MPCKTLNDMTSAYFIHTISYHSSLLPKTLQPPQLSQVLQSNNTFSFQPQGLFPARTLVPINHSLLTAVCHTASTYIYLLEEAFPDNLKQLPSLHLNTVHNTQPDIFLLYLSSFLLVSPPPSEHMPHESLDFVCLVHHCLPSASTIPITQEALS